MFIERIGSSVARQRRRRTLLLSSAVIGTLLIGPSVSACSSEKPLPQPFTTSNQEYNQCETLRSLVVPHSLPLPPSVKQLFSDPDAWNPVKQDFEQWKEQFTAEKYQGIEIFYSLGATVGYPDEQAIEDAKELATQLITDATEALDIHHNSEPYLFLDPTRQSSPHLSVIANAYLC